MSDVEQIMGLVQAENIQVHAESYDVALDMSFPKGTFVYLPRTRFNGMSLFLFFFPQLYWVLIL